MATKPTYHILLCNSFRAKGEPKGVCHKKDAVDLAQYIETEILDRGIDALLTTTGCMKQCDDGPVMVVQPNNWWYKTVDSEETVDEILDALEDNEPCEDRLLFEA
ncbi:(2Fe-2S) ferredoxin domain-containing protein [Desulfohalovibrio reitneri]|jgi:(2Fe-2S) ferredoxin|uniref:(2Fe-2S) ferredoxin domain-containing protein n=1 Tax=Desulfohalovibrio reitneri TaxID=1307759 RepID=UPI0004A6D360|nr:(2Fe-2S) ferredoxin domain-containing protein [Desulfohalovibrio reitneri]